MFIFNRTIVKSLNKNELYTECIEQYRDMNHRGYKFDMDKLRKYFNIEKRVNDFADDSDDE